MKPTLALILLGALVGMALVRGAENEESAEAKGDAEVRERDAVTDAPSQDELKSAESEDQDDDKRQFFASKLVNFINKKAKGKKFKAQIYKQFEGKTIKQLKGFLGAEREEEEEKHWLDIFKKKHNKDGLDILEKKHNKDGQHIRVKRAALPASFDVATKWPKCNWTFSDIQSQSQCGACWAVSSAAMMTDRRCIVYNGTVKPRISAWDIVSCCPDCAPSGNGCDGGYLSRAFIYMVDIGVVTGGAYGSTGCKPYPLSPSATTKPTSTACSQSCQASYTSPTYIKDRRKTFDLVFVREDPDIEGDTDEGAIMEEIYARGPVVASYDVYEDFYTYKSGVYRHTTGSYVGGHAVKIVGWGTASDGTPYWRVANSWGTNWGMKGYFNILRGSNHVNFESNIWTTIALAN